MNELNIRDYEVNDFDQYTSDFINQVTRDFTRNIAELYKSYKEMVVRYNTYNENMNRGLDWLTAQYGAIIVGDYTVTGYSDPADLSALPVPPDNPDRITVDKVFGQFYLRSYPEDKISRYLGDNGEMVAYASNKVYKLVGSTWVEDSSMLAIINNDNNIWSATIQDAPTLDIAISTNPDFDKKANIFEVYPFAGTLVETVAWKISSNEYETKITDSKFPVQIIGDFDFHNELKLRLHGVDLGDGKYYYSLRYVHIYQAEFAETGGVIYDVGDWSEIQNITLAGSLDGVDFDENLPLTKPVKIELLSEDLSVVYYDSDTSVYGFPLRQTISINPTPIPLRMRVTLKVVEGITPCIEWINLE